MLYLLMLMLFLVILENTSDAENNDLSVIRESEKSPTLELSKEEITVEGKIFIVIHKIVNLG